MKRWSEERQNEEQKTKNEIAGLSQPQQQHRTGGGISSGREFTGLNWAVLSGWDLSRQPEILLDARGIVPLPDDPLVVFLVYWGGGGASPWGGLI